MKNQKLIQLANWIAARFIRKELLEEFLGDLNEIYEERNSAKGKLYATMMYWADMIHLVIGFARILKFKTQNNNIIMVKTMLKIAWRNAIRNKQFAMLNILGLAIGITTCVYIGLYIQDEMSYDEFHEKADRIYRVNQPLIWSDWDKQFASTGPNVAIALRSDMPEFEEVTRILSLGSQTLRIKDKLDGYSMFREEKYFAADDNFFKVFSFEFLQGNQATAMIEPYSVVITRQTAEKYFGYDDPIGRRIEVKQVDGSWNGYTVKGVLENIPSRSHIQFDMLVSMNSYSEMMKMHEWKWIWTAFSTYGLVKPGTDVELLREKIQALPPKWASTTTERIFNMSYEEYTQGKDWTLYLQPLKELYLSGNPAKHRFGPTGNPQFIKIFGSIGLLVLILSCINFMNLTTAKSITRAKEIGIRKVLGSERSGIIQQFIFESILFVTISTLIAFVLAHSCLDLFNVISEKQLSILTFISNPTVIFFTIIFILVVGLIAGSYPAFYLSGFKPVDSFKGQKTMGRNGKNLRNGLVIFQFSISIGLLVFAFLIQKQLNYTSNFNTGFDRNNLLQIHHMDQLGPGVDVLKSKFEANPAVQKTGKSDAIPPNIWDGERYKTKLPQTPVVDMSNFRTEGDFLELLGVEFIAGRNFDAGRLEDRYGVILNEEAVKQLEWGSSKAYMNDSPVGKTLVCAFDNEEELEVIGVVKDFNYNGLKQKIEPLVILHQDNDRIWNYGRGRSFLSMRLNPAVINSSLKLQQLIEQIQHDIAEIDESVMFEYSFMDREFENTFKSEQRMAAVVNVFTIMAMIIAGLGLYGLSSYSAEQRAKELGIRKVLGASAAHLIMKFSSDFLKLIAIAMFVAVPVSYIVMDAWLEAFPYRTSIDLWVYVSAIFGAMVLALLSTSLQSYRSVHRNPVEVLKDE